jgi:hypothetical protein
VTTFSPYPSVPGASPEYQDGPPPVLLAVAGPAPQRRLTVLIRLILLIPHIIVLYCLMLAGAVVAFLGWWGALFTGRLPVWAGDFLAGILRWAARVSAYGLLLTDVYPPFSFNDELAYPVRLALPEPGRLNRAAVFFRIILVIPAAILAGVLGYGAGTLIAFIAWLITLVGGRLPASLHEAFTAVVRYTMRYYAYYLMLTPAYPGGLYGDKQGTPAWADPAAVPGAAAPGTDGPNPPYPADTAGPDVTPPFGAAPGYGTTESVYGTAPGGYGAPYSPYAAPGGAAAAAGYGTGPVFQPATWSLLLTSGAKKLVTTFIVLGALLLAGNIALQVARGHSVANAVVASDAIAELNAAQSTLGTQLTAYQNAVQACGQNLTCVTGQDAKAAADFAAFNSKLQATPLPAGAASAGARLGADATKMVQALTLLSHITNVSQYESTVTSSGLAKSSAAFDADYSALGEKLSSY